MKRTWRAALAAITMAGAVSVASAGGTAGATNIGNEGCTPGYWKNHTSNWQEYRPSRLVNTVFTIPTNLESLGKLTFLKALQGGGGAGVQGAAKILLRAAVAGFLNAAHEGVGYPYRRFNEPFEILERVDAALASGNRKTMLDLAAQLDAANNLGCPLN